jgi:ubiquinone/menaquinone biosynthesis C-methylase UbiE
MLKLARKFKDLGLEGKQARQYNAFSREYRMRDFQEYAALAASYLGWGASVLEVAAGPGYFCIELAKLGEFKITGLDISGDLVEIAGDNASEAGVKVDFIQGNASAIPLPDVAFDLVFCSWAVKNFMEPVKALNEMYRVLRPGGMAIIVDLNHDATSEDWRRYAADRGLRGMTALAMRIAFVIQRSGAYSASQFERLLDGGPFQRRENRSRGINLCISLTK